MNNLPRNKLRDKTVLAIDDTAAIRTFLRISLMDQGVEFHEAANAADGLEKCLGLKPDVVVLDLGLPDKDGLDLLPLLKAAAKKHRLTVIVLTVRSDRTVKERAFRRGADAYLTKPFEMDDLVETMEALVA